MNSHWCSMFSLCCGIRETVGKWECQCAIEVSFASAVKARLAEFSLTGNSASARTYFRVNVAS